MNLLFRPLQCDKYVYIFCIFCILFLLLLTLVLIFFGDGDFTSTSTIIICQISLFLSSYIPTPFRRKSKMTRRQCSNVNYCHW